MTNEEMLGVAEIVDRLVTRFHKQAADHETKMAEHRASFGARTDADAKLIAGLREERNGLLTQVQDTLDASLRELEQIDRLINPYREESTVIVVKRMLDQHRLIAREYDKAVSLCETEEQTPEQCIVSLNARIDRLQDDARDYYKDREVIRQINLDLRAEIAALQERLRASIARGDLAQIEVAALKSQTPKQHPVTVGEWVRRLVPSPACGVGTVAKVVQVDDTSEIYDVKRIDGQHGVWFAKNCEPCDPPTEATHAMPAGKKAAEAVRDDRKIAPKPGDTVRLVRIPSRDDVSSELKTELEWPWIERWGTLNQTALVVEPAYQLDGALSVCLSTNVHVRWPISCIEVITEATHDTEAGKAAAESAAKTEPVADEIKVGDLVEVVSNRGRNTWLVDVGSLGIVTSVEYINDSISVHLDDVPGKKKNALVGCVSFCDVRKVTQ